MSDVSRSDYQKLSEENKKLKQDIIILTSEEYSFTPEKILLISKWRELIRKEKDFREIMKEISTTYLKEHPEFDITSASFRKP